MAGLPAVGELTYNGYTFTGSTHITSSQEPVPDDAGRTVVYVRIRIEVEATIAFSSTDATVESVRRLLSKPGGSLLFQSKGFGDDLVVNHPGGRIRDVRNGPTPEILAWKPIGSNNACFVRWAVTTHVPMSMVSSGARYAGVAALNYEMDFDRDERGNVTRTISGYIEIAQTRHGSVTNPDKSRKIRETADEYFNQMMQVTVPLGFYRRVRRRISKDKRRLDFTITDTEIQSKNPFPSKIVGIRGSHSVHWMRSNGQAMKYRNVISMEIEPEVCVDPSYAWSVFYTIVTKRMWHAKQMKRAVFLEELVAEEDLFGRASRFRAGYRFMGAIKDFIGDSGLWQPLGTDWARWRASIPTQLIDPRGHSQLSDEARWDVIVDLCAPQTPIKIDQDSEQCYQRPPTRRPKLENEKPPESDSYISYRMSIVPYRTRPVARQALLQEPDDTSIANSAVSSTDFQFGTKTPPKAMDDVIVETGRSSYGLLLTGSAVRVGYEPPRPEVKTIGSLNRPATEEGSWFRLWCMGNFFGVPVYAAQWRIKYALPGAPGVVAYLTSTGKPDEGLDANGNPMSGLKGKPAPPPKLA